MQTADFTSGMSARQHRFPARNNVGMFGREMTRKEAVVVARALREFAGQAAGEYELTRISSGRPLKGFHVWADGRPLAAAYAVRRREMLVHLLLIDWKGDGTFYCVLYNARKNNPHAEMYDARSLEGRSVLSWTYSPRKRDGANDRRKKRFMKQAGGLTVDVRLPRSGAETGAFLDALFELVDTRERADDLRARLREPHKGIFKLPDEMRTFVEGASERIVVNRFERDPRARQACIERWGSLCHVCGVDFAQRYGPSAAGLIHVHHLKQLAATGKHAVDPVRDLRPVCPNCHAVMHLVEPPHTPAQVRSMLRRHSSR